MVMGGRVNEATDLATLKAAIANVTYYTIERDYLFFRSENNDFSVNRATGMK